MMVQQSNHDGRDRGEKKEEEAEEEAAGLPVAMCGKLVGIIRAPEDDTDNEGFETHTTCTHAHDGPCGHE